METSSMKKNLKMSHFVINLNVYGIVALAITGAMQASFFFIYVLHVIHLQQTS